MYLDSSENFPSVFMCNSCLRNYELVCSPEQNVYSCKFHSLLPAEENIVDIMEYLTELGKSEIHKLGLVLGLSNAKLETNMDSNNFLIPAIAAWLRKEDYVKMKGEPTWTTLVNALKHPTVKQEGIANRIAQDKL